MDKERIKELGILFSQAPGGQHVVIWHGLVVISGPKALCEAYIKGALDMDAIYQED